MKKPIDKKVMEALEHTFNSEKVSKLNDAQYKQFIESCCALTLGTMIKAEGRRYAKEFCQASLNDKGAFPVVQQVKRH